MIVGLGIDIIDNRRIENTIKKYGLKFKKRCFLENEITKSNKRIKQINFFAKRYAAKEACAKALGTGLAKGVFWKDIEVFNDHNGKPFIKLHNKALNLLNIHSYITGKTLEKTRVNMAGKDFSKLKKQLSDALIATICPIGRKIKENAR